MSIFDTDINPITKKFLKDKGFIRQEKAFIHNDFPGVFIYTSDYPTNFRNLGHQPNTATILYYSAWDGFERIDFDNVYTERDVEMVLSVWEQKYKYKW